MTTELIRYLDEEGNLINNYKPELSEDKLRYIYDVMILTREFDNRSLKLQRQGRIGFYIGCKGQEASHIGSAYALNDNDWIFPSYREPGILFLRKVPIYKLFCQMMGNEGDPCHGRQMPCHFSHKEVNFVSISSPLATQIPHAVGAAYAMKYNKQKTVSVTYFGDGSTSEGDFHVALNFAGVYKTPTIFICENNQWAISVPITKQTASESIAIKGISYGIESFKVDGNDIFAVYEITKKAVEKARNFGGPTLIENYTYRLGSHSSSDDATRYRNNDEYEMWLKKDPIVRFEKYLLNEGIINKDYIESQKKFAEEEINNAIKEAEKLKNPTIETLFTDVYENIPNNLREQMEQLIEEQKRLGESEDNSLAFPL